ncbi:MAG: nicotinate phosphoribosyltransferase [Alphaproteobacteria bacterium]|nr:nicotinate phosphoribosyltransferase [Alphaproteobacteria bacterium]
MKTKNFWCDFYHLTTAQTLFKENMHETPDTFEAFIRKNPFNGGYTISAGLGPILQWLNKPGYSDRQIAKLVKMKYADGTPKFSSEFLGYIKNAPCMISVKALPEGELAFPNEPTYQVIGPKWQVLMVETAILNAMNSSSLIATKTSRVKYAAGDKVVSEFGLRRMQELYGLNVTRSAIIGGADFTSNVDAGLEFDVPLSGTHPHAYVMSFDSEYEAFYTWLKHNPNNPTLLVDTYDTITGVKNAIKAAKALGMKAINIRLDSGDLAYLSKQARKMFDDAGMHDSRIVASNDLDEHVIQSLNAEGAQIDIYGVGTNMVTSADQPALGGVYKIKKSAGKDKIKFSEDPIKTTIPGATETIRMLDMDGKFNGDVIMSVNNIFESSGVLKQPLYSINPQNGKVKVFDVGQRFYKPAVYVVKNGTVDKKAMKRTVSEISKSRKENLDRLDEAHRQLRNPREYVAGIEQSLYQYQQKLIEQNQKIF